MPQVRVGWRSPISTSTLWNSIYSVYNADSTGSSSLKTSLYAAYNGESNANDSFGSNNATPQGGLTYTTGKIGNAFTFNGTNGYVALPDNSLNLTGDFTISAWVYHIASGGQMIASNYAFTSNTLNKGWELGIDIISGTQNRVGFLIAQGPSNTAYTGWEFITTGLVQNAWNHIVIKRVSGVDTYCWINGVSQAYILKGTGANITLDPTYHTTNKANIGSFMTLAGVASTFMKNGTKIDSLNVWNRVLTQSEITELYNSGNGAQYITNDFYKPTTNDELNLRNGTPQGGLTYGVGKVGTAFQFNGTNAYVSLPDNSMNLTGDFTISLWVYPVSGAAQNLLNNRAFTSGTINKGWGLGINNVSGGQTSKVTWVQGIGPASNQYTGWEFRTTSLTLNDWNHVIITRVSGVNTYCWVNNISQTPTIFGTGANVALDPIYHTTQKNSLGAFLTLAGVASYFTPSGTKVDELNIWNRQLTPDERTQIYNSGNGKQYPN